MKSIPKERAAGVAQVARRPEDLARPLIVFGMGRSGTRMCANILNNSRDVELQGEIGGPTGSKMMAWLESVRAEKKPSDIDRMYRLAREAFRDGNSSSRRVRPRARWFGHKTPRHERHFARYEAVFDDPRRLAHYVYCLRNPFHVWRSYRAMPWNKFKTVESFLEAWKKSVRTYEGIVAVAPDRITVFNLDAMIRAPDRLGWLEPHLLEPLGISADSFRRPVEDLQNTNSASNKLGAKPEPPPESENAAIAADREVQRMVRTYFPWMAAELDAYAAQAPLHKRLFRFRAA